MLRHAKRTASLAVGRSALVASQFFAMEIRTEIQTQIESVIKYSFY